MPPRDRRLELVTQEAAQGPVPELDTTKAHQARVYDYWLGGKDNFPADRAAAEQAIRDFPGIRAGARAQRAFLGRAVRYLAGPAGLRQFLDIGTGIPAANNTHEVAQAVAPESRVVYVDNDPLVLAHARALLASGPQGITDYLDADLRETGTILRRAEAILDFSRPVAVMLVGILQLIPDEDEPDAIVRRIMAALPAGSSLAVAHPADDIEPELVRMAERLNQRSAVLTTLRGRAEITGFFDGLDLIEPGVVQLHRWEPGVPAPDSGPEMPAWCGLAFKP